MLRKNIYKWHRTISLIIAVPVVLWAASGFLHPLMTTIRPKVSTQWLPPQPIDSSKIKIPLQQALQQNNIAAINNFRIVQMAGNWFYQLQLPGNNIQQYISTQTGKVLANGDELYARQLAKQFLQGVKKPEGKLLASVNNDIIQTAEAASETTVHDCCFNATAAIMNDTTGVKILSAVLVNSYTDEYKNINRFLPAYKVSFARADGIRIYVETAQDRFAFAMDNKRAVFDTFFSLFHTWSWLNFLGNGKLIVEAALCLMAFATTLMGLYIFFITKTKKANGNGIVKARNNHRWTSLVFSLFTLMFTGSGAFHAIDKITPDNRDQFYVTNQFESSGINLNIEAIAAAIPDKSITNISLVKIDSQNYWQVFTKKAGNAFTQGMEKQKGDLMKDKTVQPPQTVYINTATNQILANGERIYAAYLAAAMSKHAVTDTTGINLITKFEGEYGFVNKRLPVWKVNYPFNHNERWYVETSTGKLAAKVNDNDLIEGYSFAMLHKHHFMDFAGKTWRDFSTMFWAMAQIVMVAIGLTLYFKMRRRKKAGELQ